MFKSGDMVIYYKNGKEYTIFGEGMDKYEKYTYRLRETDSKGRMLDYFKYIDCVEVDIEHIKGKK